MRMFPTAKRMTLS